MNKLKTLIKKEILDILRDRKTLIIMVVVPILLYPAIIIGMVFAMNLIANSMENKEYIVAYPAEDENYMKELEEIYHSDQEAYDFKLSFCEAVDNISASEKETENDYDIRVDVEENAQGIHMIVKYTSTDQDSAYAESALKELSDDYNDILLSEKLRIQGLEEEFIHPLTYEAKDSATVSESIGMNIGGTIGMMLIVTIMLGAFYPAIDATTGEKERGTLETLLTLPVSNFQMIMSKFIAVSVFACVTAILSLLSLGVSVVFLIDSALAGSSSGFAGFDLSMMISWMPMLILVMITTALLITAFCMCFCIFAKSFKEANNYITPVMLIVMFASMVSMIPSVELNYYTSLIPIVNVSLLLKAVLAQQMNLSLAGITIGINLCYSILIIWILSKMYDSENILFTDGFQSFQIFQKRSEIKEGSIPNTGDVLLSIVVLFLLIMYIGTAVSARSVFAGTIVTQLLILAVPFAVTIYMKSNLKQLFSLHVPVKKSVLSGFFLYVGTFCLMMPISMALTKMFPESTQNLEFSFAEILKQPFALIVLVMAVMPAVGEELFFRGFVFGSLKHKYHTRVSIIVSALIFGVFHMSIVKVLPTAMLGACFAYITWKSGSIYISMLLHFVNNLLSVISMKYPELIAKSIPVLTKESYSGFEIMSMIVVGILCLAIGFVLGNKKFEKNVT